MDLRSDYNQARPLIMHIDLNSCFATVEQQARPLLRGRPVAIVNRRTDKTMVITASYEAKARGVSLGMKVYDARKLAPDLVVLESDPPKYRYVYRRLLSIMERYSPHVTMKSIDEGVIDFSHATEAIKSRDLAEVGYEIKRALKDEIGCWMRCNIGIGPNRFLAKTAAGLNKPDGLDVVSHHNLRTTLAGLKLTDLTGIAGKYQARLNGVGIYTPLEFLDASPLALHKMVFKSINGLDWHQRLRGWEVDDVDYDVKTVGRQYVLETFDLSREEILQRLHHLCESVGQRMRSKGKVARGVVVSGRSRSQGYWHQRRLMAVPFFSDNAIYSQAAQLLSGAPADLTMIAVSCYNLSDGLGDQLSLFGDEITREQAVTSAIDEINARYGERTVHSADTLDTNFYIKQKVPFGSTRYL